jgi:prepilin-type N-terminal cleavage/methylation domain-containing protein
MDMMTVSKRLFGKKTPWPAKRGFTLIEIAFVLGIIGLVISGIFAAASLATRRITSNEGSDELYLIAGNMRALYSGRNPSFASLNAVRSLKAIPDALDFCFYTVPAVSQGVFPNEMVLPRPLQGALPAPGAVANDPWSTAGVACSGVAGGSAQVGLASTIPPPPAVQLVVRYNGIPQDGCADVLVRTSMPDANTGVRRIYVNGTLAGDVSVNSLPLTSITAAAACNAAINVIDWYYNLTG